MTEHWNIQSLPVGEIMITDGRRELQRAKVDTLRGSMQRLGLQSPIGVRMVDGKPYLVYGLHRFCAAQDLEWDSIHCRIFEGDDRRARMAEISENLHRAELTALEEAEQVAEWIRLVEELRQEISAQSAQKIGRGRPEGGQSAAAREIGVDRDAVRRAQRIAALPAEAKAAARDLGLADNQAALLKAAKAQDPVLSLHQRVKQRRHTPEERAQRRAKRAEQQKEPEHEFPGDEHSAAIRAAALDRVVITLSHMPPHRIADVVRDLETGMGPNPLAEALRARHPKLFDHGDREDQALPPATGAGLVDDQEPVGAPVPGTDLAGVAPLDCSDASGPDTEGSTAAPENGDSSESARAVEPDREPDEVPAEEVDAPQIGTELEEAEQASRDAEDASGKGQATWPPLPIAETAEASAEALYGQRTDATAARESR
jgi:ParB-like chromosome segregation protein Spo0J